jgi:hypothetical protein
MRRVFNYSWLLIAVIFTMSFSGIAYGQTFKTAVSYLNYINQQQEEITKDYWDYTSSIAHSTNARKVEKRRIELIKTTQTAINKISQMPDYNGDVSLRDSMLSYLKMIYNLLVEDYAKLWTWRKLQSSRMMQWRLICLQRIGLEINWKAHQK